MKKLNTICPPLQLQRRILLILTTFVLCTTIPLTAQERNWRTLEGRDFGNLKWYEIKDRPDVTFREVQKAFYKEWEGKDYESGKGYKQFKRWEIQMRGLEKEFLVMKKGDYQFKYHPRTKSNARNPQNNWTPLGPRVPAGTRFRGIGRIDAVAFDAQDERIIYVGSPSGGLWKSIDAGTTWNIISDETWPSASIADIVVNPTNSQQIYVATRDNPAQGLMRSEDGGQSWEQLPRNINAFSYNRLLLHPSSEENSPTQQELILGTSTGVYTSRDGGISWEVAAFPQEITLDFWGRPKVRIYDIEFHPEHSNILYAASEGALFISNDNGRSFQWINAPFDSDTAGRIEVAVSPSTPDAAYFLVSDSKKNELLGIYKYEANELSKITSGAEPITYPNGQSISFLSQLGDGRWGQIWYNWSFAVNPNDANDMIAGAIDAFRTKDGGQTWQYISTPNEGGGDIHADVHAIAYHPKTNIPFIGCDGGTYKWIADGEKWLTMHDMDISELYTIAASETQPEHFIIGCQDNGGFYYEKGTWSDLGGGDDLNVAIDPVNPNIIYNTGSYFTMQITKSTDGGKTSTGIFREDEIGEPTSSVFEQPQIEQHPYLRHVLFANYDNVYKSIDSGTSWENISNGQIGNNFKSVLKVAPSDPAVIYVASYQEEDAIFYKTINGGQNWETLNWPKSDQYDDLLQLAISDKDPNHIFIGTGDRKVFESKDGGKNWTDISNGLSGAYIRDLKYLQGSNDELYMSTREGMYYKNGAADWIAISGNLPMVSCTQMSLSPIDNKIRTATYGRGVWESTLQQPSNICYAPTPNIVYDKNFCSTEGVSLSLESLPDGYEAQWYVGDELIKNQNSTSLFAKKNGSYSVRYIGPCKSFSSDIVNINLIESISTSSETFDDGIPFYQDKENDFFWTLRDGSWLTDSYEGDNILSLYLYNGESNKFEKATLETSCYNVCGLNPSVTFDYRLTGNNLYLSTFRFEVTNNAGQTWTPLFTADFSDFSSFGESSMKSERIDLSPYAGQDLKFRFFMETGAGFADTKFNWGGILINNFIFEVTPSNDVAEIPNNSIDENCDGIVLIIDKDQDGYHSDEDCDDNNPSINAEAEEVPNNNVDENCDGLALLIDNDNDGYNSSIDCDDNDATVNSGATEIPDNGIDEDCNGADLVTLTDQDNDGYLNDVDCDDNNASINPNAPEIANNNVDENCDGIALLIDNDNDGYNSSIDCDDNNATVNSGATEIPDNGIDEDCDGADLVTVVDLDNDGYLSDVDCDDNNATINPNATEVPNNNIDENCDGIALLIDNDNDGYNSSIDCDDNNATVNSGATEIPDNGIDEDCNGTDLVTLADKDNDGYLEDVDCNDENPNINPGASETANSGFDENCDGESLLIDEDNDGWNSSIDCDDNNPNVNGAATEIANNGIDEDCDGQDLITTNIHVIEGHKLSVYPNPVSHQLTIAVPSQTKLALTYEVYDLTGKSVIPLTPFSSTTSINFDQLTTGTFLLKITSVDSNHQILEKIIKIK